MAVAKIKKKGALTSWNISKKNSVKISFVRWSIAESVAQIQIYNPFYC